MAKILIQKANGESEPFEETKLATSLRRSGASEGAIMKIVEHVLGELRAGMSTHYIYKHAFSLLKKIEERPAAARYSLRRSVLAMGPSGYAFEDYVSEIYKALGYTSSTQVIVQGKCAEHEVDVVAQKGEQYIGAELKFHNSLGIKTDLKTALYVGARYDDILKNSSRQPKITEGWLITNTKFTYNATEYAKCAGLNIIGWDYPKGRNLEDLIQETKVYPITCLPSLSDKAKQNLLENKKVLCRDLGSDVGALKNAGVKPSKIDTVISESQALCGV